MAISLDQVPVVTAKGQILSTANVLFAEMCAFQIAIEAGQPVISLSTRPKVNMILFSTILFVVQK